MLNVVSELFPATIRHSDQKVCGNGFLNVAVKFTGTQSESQGKDLECWKLFVVAIKSTESAF